MIGRLKGTVAAVDGETAIVEVGGVGYEIHGGARLMGGLAAGEAATVAIETVVREDMIRLYGFASEADKRAFRLLQGVPGVGAKHALAVLDVLNADALADAIAGADATALARAHGVGKKLAQRIVAELAGKIGGLAAIAPLRAAPAAANEAGPAADAVSALVNLGYDAFEARRAVAAAEGADAPALIKSALQRLSAA